VEIRADARLYFSEVSPVIQAIAAARPRRTVERAAGRLDESGVR